MSRSTSDAPSGAKVVQVDYSSVESLSAALKGHDAVVSTANGAATPSLFKLIDAAIIAGVKRFIPNEFSSISSDPKARDIPVYQLFIQNQDYLKEKAQAGKIEYTIFATGPFLEYTFGSPLFLDYHNRSIDVYGDGNIPISTTSIAGIGKAIAGVLKRSDETKNRFIYVHEAVVTQNRLLALAKKISPEGAAWTENKVDQEEALRAATEKFVQDPTDQFATFGLLRAAMLSGKYDAEYREVDNDLVGVSLLSDEELEKNFLPLLTAKQE